MNQGVWLHADRLIDLRSMKRSEVGHLIFCMFVHLSRGYHSRCWSTNILLHRAFECKRHGSGQTLGSPFGQAWAHLIQGSEWKWKFAFHNLSLSCFCILYPYLYPLLWKVMCKIALFLNPLRTRIVYFGTVLWDSTLFTFSQPIITKLHIHLGLPLIDHLAL